MNRSEFVAARHASRNYAWRERNWYAKWRSANDYARPFPEVPPAQHYWLEMFFPLVTDPLIEARSTRPARAAKRRAARVKLAMREAEVARFEAQRPRTRFWDTVARMDREQLALQREMTP